MERKHMEEDFELSPEEEAALEALMGELRSLPKHALLMADPKRYAEVVKSANAIATAVKEDYPDAEVKLDFDKLTGSSLLLTIITEGANIYNVKKFCEAIAPADTMDIEPRNDGKVEIGFLYKKVRKPMPPITPKR